MEMVKVNGPETCDVYKFLRSAKLKNQNSTKNAIEWNWAKFVVGSDGQVLKLWPSCTLTVSDLQRMRSGSLPGIKYQTS